MMGLLNFFWILLITGVLYSCSSIECESPRYVQLADEITNKTAKALEKEKDVVLVGTGGQMMHDIQLMRMCFDLYHEVSLEEARELIVFSIEEYLKNINENKEIRQYLHEDPFTAKNIEIWLWLCNPDGSYLSSDKMSYILSSNGKIEYFSESSNSCELLYKEDYEKAFKIVNSLRIE